VIAMQRETCEVKMTDAAKADLQFISARNERAAIRALRAIRALSDDAFDGATMRDGSILADAGLRKIYCDERAEIDAWETTRRLHGRAPMAPKFGANLRVVYRLHRKPNSRLTAMIIAVGVGHRNERSEAYYGRGVTTVYELAAERVEKADVLFRVPAPTPLAA
jgi:hypothetical protein